MMKLLTTNMPPRLISLRFGAYLLAAAVLAGTIVLGLKGWRIYGAVQQLRADSMVLETLARAPQAGPEGGATAALEQLRRDLRTLHGEAAPLLPVTRYLGWVPTYG